MAVAAAISVTESADVFVATTASGRQIRSSSAKSACFASSSSTIASITRSQDARSASSVVVDEARERRVALVLRALPLLDLPREEVPDAIGRDVAERRAHLAADDVEACFDRDLRDAGAHRAEPHDPDALHGHHGRGAYTGPRFSPGSGAGDRRRRSASRARQERQRSDDEEEDDE